MAKLIKSFHDKGDLAATKSVESLSRRLIPDNREKDIVRHRYFAEV